MLVFFQRNVFYILVLELGQAFVMVPMYRFQWKWCCETSEIWLEKATQLLLTYLRTFTLGAFTNYVRSLTILRKPCRKPCRKQEGTIERQKDAPLIWAPAVLDCPAQTLEHKNDDFSFRWHETANDWETQSKNFLMSLFSSQICEENKLSVLVLHHSYRTFCCRAADNWNIRCAEYQPTSPSSGNMGVNDCLYSTLKFRTKYLINLL